MQTKSISLGAVAALASVMIFTACSTGSGTGSSAATASNKVGTSNSNGSPVTVTGTHAAATGSFCADVKSLTIKAAAIARALTTYSPAQIKAAIDADRSLENTAEAEAPAALRSDLALANNENQFKALEQAGYDLSKVDQAKLHPTPGQKAALTRVQGYLRSTCGFDPTKILPSH